MNAPITLATNNFKPLSVVCDESLLHVIEPLVPQIFPIDSELTGIQDWLSSERAADMFICSEATGFDIVKTVRERSASIYLVVVVDDLSHDNARLLLAAGVSELITPTELNSGRFELLLHGRFNVNNKATSDDQSQADERLDLQMRNSFMSSLSDVSARLMERMTMDELMDEIAVHAVSLSNSESAFVSMLHETGSYLEIRGASGQFAEFMGFQHNKMEDVAGLAWDLEELVLMEGESSEEGYIELWGTAKKRCAVPFFVNKKLAGVLCVSLDSDGASLTNHLDILKLFARMVSLAIENCLLINNQKEELARNMAVGEITQSFYSASNLRELIDGVCKSMLSVFDSKLITVCRIGADKKFAVLAEWQQDKNEVRRTSFSNVNMMTTSICQWCVDNKKAAFVPNGFVDDRQSDASRRINKLLGIGCAISIPLIQDDVVWGMLTMGKDAGQRNYTDVEISLLELLATQLSSSVMRQNLLDKIHFQAFHDSLTKLPNRHMFENRLNQLVSADGADQSMFALMFLDLDGFKAVNDNQGHTVGDELLKSVSNRLTGCLHERDLLARMGGDEFAVLLRGVKSNENAHAIALRLSNAIDQNFIVDKYNIKIGVSIGLSFYPDNGVTADDLLRNADFAMYEAKAEGNSSVRVFSESMSIAYRKRIALESDLLHAIENEQFELHYQPKINLADNVVTGVEALLRWNHPEQGYVSPEEFIALAEEAGYITEIGKWVVNEAVRQNSIWVASGLTELVMAVNISAPQFMQEDFTSSVLDTLSAHKLDSSQLELEVTESVVKNNVSKVICTLNEIRDAGISIAVDDFGTGYSSLAFLEQLPLDCLKIDKVFVDKLDDGDAENTLVNTIITLARSFGWHTVAEGVESAEQVQKLVSLGCHSAQGFYYSKPVTASEIPALVELLDNQFGNMRKAS